MLVSAITDDRSSPDHPLGDAVDTFFRREDAKRFVEEVRCDEPEIRRAPAEALPSEIGSAASLMALWGPKQEDQVVHTRARRRLTAVEGRDALFGGECLRRLKGR